MKTKELLHKTVCEILDIQFRQDRWARDVEKGLTQSYFLDGEVSINDPVSGGQNLLRLALDVLGVPKERDCKRPTRQGDCGGKCGCYSRDLHRELYRIMVQGRRDIKGFVDVITGRVKIPAGSYFTDELERKLYPRKKRSSKP